MTSASTPERASLSGMFKKFRWRMEAALFMGGTFLFSLVPVSLLTPAGSLLGRLCFRVLGSRRRVALDSITQSLPSLPPGSDPEQIARDCFMNLGISFLENCKLYHGFSTLLNSVAIEGLENFRAAHARGTGVLFVTGHCGNWEFSSLCFGLRQTPMAVMVREQKNPYLTRCIETIRSQYGNTIIHKKGALREIIRVLRQGGVVGILIDQAVMPHEGYQVEFLGRPAWTTSMPVLMARKTGAVLLPGFISREGAGHKIAIQPAVEFPDADMSDEALARDTATLTGYVEEFVKSHPSQWYWVHRRWKERAVQSGQVTASPQ